MNMHNIISDKKRLFKTGTTKILGKRIILRWQLYVLLLPTILSFLIFRYGPIFGLTVAFIDFIPKIGQNYFTSIINSPWVGLGNFKTFFNSLQGPVAFKNTFVLSFLKLIFGFPAPIILALLLNEIKSLSFKKLAQSITYLPHFISWVIFAGIIKIIVNPDSGLLKPIFAAIGSDNINLLGNANYFRGLLVVTDIWKTIGWGTIIYMASFTNIDSQLYEAAIIDGASRLQVVFRITLPLITPTIVVLLIMRLGIIMSDSFDQVFNLYNAAVYSKGDILGTYMYREGIDKFRLSYSTAVSFLQSTIGFTLVVLANFIAKRLGQEGVM